MANSIQDAFKKLEDDFNERGYDLPEIKDSHLCISQQVGKLTLLKSGEDPRKNQGHCGR